MQSEILFESQKKYLLTALFMQKMLEERNSSENALNLAVFTTKSGEFVVFFSGINCDLYHYAGNNPVKYTDPDGNFVEIAWDILSLSTGITSLCTNIKTGNIKGAIIDGLGIVADAAAVALPFIPGGASAAIKISRAVGAVSNIAGGSLTVVDGIENKSVAEVAVGGLQVLSGAGQLKTFNKISKANVSDLVPNPADSFDYEAGNYSYNALSEARDDIKANGNISNPISVKKLENGKFQIQDGHHRWKAAQQMNIKVVPIEIIE